MFEVNSHASLHNRAMLFVVNLNIECTNTRMHALVSGIVFVVKCENILASLYVTQKGSHLTSAQSSITGLYSVRHSPVLLLTLNTSLVEPFLNWKGHVTCSLLTIMIR